GGADAAGNSAIVLRSNGAIATADLLRVVEGPDPSSNVRFVIDNSGSVGIATSTPGTFNTAAGKVTIAQTGASNDTPGLLIAGPTVGSDVTLSLVNVDTSGRHWQLISSGGGTGIGAGNFSIYDRTTGGTAARLSINSTGFVGMSSTSPGRTLDVGGSFMVKDNTILGDAAGVDTLTVNASSAFNGTVNASSTVQISGTPGTGLGVLHLYNSGDAAVLSASATGTIQSSPTNLAGNSAFVLISKNDIYNGDFIRFTTSTPTSTILRWGFTTSTLGEVTTSTWTSHVNNVAGATAFAFDTATAMTSSSAGNPMDRALMVVKNGGTNKFAISAGGNVYATAGFNANSTQYGIGDVAEYVNLIAGEIAEPGDVLMADTVNSNQYRRADVANATTVAGVVTDTNAVTIGSAGPGRAALALAGFVNVKVTDENGPITTGDILVASTKPGYAMRFDSAKDTSGMVGVLGVALESFSSGAGKITALVKTGWVNSVATTMRTLTSDVVALGDNAGIQVEAKKLTAATSASGAITSTAVSSPSAPTVLSATTIASLAQTNGTWSLTEDGRVLAKSVEADSVKAKAYKVQQDADKKKTTMGRGTIPSGNGNYRVENENVSTNTNVMITFFNNPEGNWWISDLGNGYFEISLSVAPVNSLGFNYWLVEGVPSEEPAPKEEDSVATAPAVEPAPATETTTETASVSEDTSVTATPATEVTVTEPVVTTDQSVTDSTSTETASATAETTMAPVSETVTVTATPPADTVTMPAE
ncbi:MAG: collagen-like protein, partial [Candidatus Magasanikbacteria bacterium]|nr:collagen-like protein [Candidatus Magasanikbacteria bacterium]